MLYIRSSASTWIGLLHRTTTLLVGQYSLSARQYGKNKIAATSASGIQNKTDDSVLNPYHAGLIIWYSQNQRNRIAPKVLQVLATT